MEGNIKYNRNATDKYHKNNEYKIGLLETTDNDYL